MKAAHRGYQSGKGEDEEKKKIVRHSTRKRLGRNGLEKQS